MAEDLGGMEGRSLTDAHMQLYRAYHAQQNYLKQRMAKTGLGPGQPKFLAYLAVHGPSSQSEMARYFEVDAAAVSRMLDALERNGFVHTEQSTDRRKKRCALTAKGHGALSEWDKACDGELVLMLKGFTPEESKTFLELLTRAHDNLVGEKNAEGGAK